MFKRIMLLLTVAALVTATMAVSAPLASADPAPGKDLCKDGGYQELGFEDQGTCVTAANEAYQAGEPFPPDDGEEPPVEVCPPGYIGFPPFVPCVPIPGG